jgi:hypothetical protein
MRVITTYGQLASLSWGSSTHLGLTTRFLLLSDNYGFLDVDVSVLSVVAFFVTCIVYMGDGLNIRVTEQRLHQTC